jgi:uncharacterized protein DUF6893
MKEIRIKPRAQGLTLLGVAAAIAAAMAAQAPEIRRYMKIRSM